MNLEHVTGGVYNPFLKYERERKLEERLLKEEEQKEPACGMTENKMCIEELEIATGGATYSQEYLDYKGQKLLRESGLLGMDIWTYKD